MTGPILTYRMARDMFVCLVAGFIIATPSLTLLVATLLTVLCFVIGLAFEVKDSGRFKLGLFTKDVGVNVLAGGFVLSILSILSPSSNIFAGIIWILIGLIFIMYLPSIFERNLHKMKTSSKQVLSKVDKLTNRKVIPRMITDDMLP